jgi:hypothetical protein
MKRNQTLHERYRIYNSRLPAKSQKGEREKGERERERELTWVIQQSVVEIRRACYRIDHLLMWRGVNPGSRCARLWSGGTPSPPCRQLAPVMSGSRGLASSDAAAASRITDYTPFMSALANRREPSPIRALQPMLQIPGMVRLLLHLLHTSLEPSKAARGTCVCPLCVIHARSLVPICGGVRRIAVGVALVCTSWGLQGWQRYGVNSGLLKIAVSTYSVPETRSRVSKDGCRLMWW